MNLRFGAAFSLVFAFAPAATAPPLADDFDQGNAALEDTLASVTPGLSRLAAASSVAPPARSAAPLRGPEAYATYAALFARLMQGQTADQLQDVLPGLPQRLHIAAQVSHKYWTDSNLLDANAKADILPPKAMKGLGIPRRVTAGIPHAPAGMMHTYGYLFSQLQTPYGLKGQRWIEARIDERLGLPAGTFGPEPPAGEFTSNLTAVLYRLIGVTGAPSAAAALEPEATPLGRLEEAVTWETPEGQRVSASIRTHLFDMRSVPGAAGDGEPLLVYEVVRGGRHRLVTAFPAAGGTADFIRSAKPADDTDFKPLYNLYVDPRWRVVARHSSGFLPGQP